LTRASPRIVDWAGMVRSCSDRTDGRGEAVAGQKIAHPAADRSTGPTSMRRAARRQRINARTGSSTIARGEEPVREMEPSGAGS
jgi:hypothetical protein